MTEAAERTGLSPTDLQAWQRFVRSEGHVFRTNPALIWQQGANQPKRSAVSRHVGALQSAGFDGSLRVWDASSGEEIYALRGRDDPLRIVAGGEDGSIMFWNAETGGCGP